MTKRKLLNKILYICIHAEDFEEAVKFYRDVLEFAPAQELATPRFYALRLDNVMLGIETDGFKKRAEKTKAENPILLQFEAESPEHLEEINRFLEAKGVALLKRSFETSYGTITNFLDTEGNKLEVLYQKKGNP